MRRGGSFDFGPRQLEELLSLRIVGQVAAAGDGLCQRDVEQPILEAPRVEMDPDDLSQDEEIVETSRRSPPARSDGGRRRSESWTAQG